MKSLIVGKEERLARAEKFAEAARAERLDVMQAAYQQAVNDGDENAAAEAARAIRNKLLAQSDKEVTLDRVGLDTSSPTAFLRSLKNIFDGAWTRYRKLLRDLPEQEGFPLNIAWPKQPVEEMEEVYGNQDGT